MRANITLSPKQFAVALGAVALGGAAGTVLRDLLTGLQHTPVPRGSMTYSNIPAQTSWTSQIPWILLAINFTGVLIATRLLRGPLRQHDPNDPTRLLLITGFFGGFTSYSGLFVAFAAIWHLSIGGSFLVAVGAVVSGVLAGWLGLGRRRR